MFVIKIKNRGVERNTYERIAFFFNYSVFDETIAMNGKGETQQRKS